MRRSDIVRVLSTACAAASSLAAWSGAAGGESAPAGALSMEAASLTISEDGGEVIAEGGVRLEAPDFELVGERLVLILPDGTIRLDAPFSLALRGIALEAESGDLSREGRTLRLVRPKLIRTVPPPPFAVAGERLECDGGRCVLLRAAGTACPHTPAGYRLEARRITLHPSGDVDLSSPTLFLGDARVAWLPWLRLRPPSEPGFLPPRLGYSPRAGFIAGPAGHLPLGDGAHVDGYVAGRTSQGLEDETRLRAQGLDLRVTHVLDVPDNRGRLRLALSTPLAHARIAADADLVTDREIIDETTFDPLERAMSHTDSRALLSIQSTSALLESAFAADQALGAAAGEGWPALQTVAAVHGAIVAVPNRALLWPAIDLALERRDVRPGWALFDAAGETAAPHTRLWARPSVSTPLSLGPLPLDLRVGSRHGVWLVDGETGDAPSSHAVGGAARLGLPLVGRLAGRPHLIEPRVEYRAVPWIAGSGPPWAFDGVDRPRRAHAVEVAVETRLDPFAETPLLTAELTERVGLPGLGKGGTREYLHGSLRLGAPPFDLRGEIAWDQEASTVSAAAAGVGTRDGRGNGIFIEGRWYGEGDGPHTDGRWTAEDVVWVGDGWWLPGPHDRLEIAEKGTAVLARVVTLECGARVEIFPNPGLNALWYGVGLRAPCGCAEIGLKAAHRLDTPVPDVMLTISLD